MSSPKTDTPKSSTHAADDHCERTAACAIVADVCRLRPVGRNAREYRRRGSQLRFRRNVN